MRRKEVATGKNRDTVQGGMSQAPCCDSSHELSNSRSDKIGGGRGISRVTQILGVLGWTLSLKQDVKWVSSSEFSRICQSAVGNSCPR